MTQEWMCPDADSEGFVLFETLREENLKYNRGDFLIRFPVPALLVVYKEHDTRGSDVVDPTDSGIQLLTMSIKSTAILRYLGKVAFVAKRPGNPFAHLISIGRSAKNDITMGVDSVSKVHGYFVAQDDGWCFTDHGSTNGSYINGEALESGGKYPLKDGDILQLGLEASLEFLEPASLHKKIQRLPGP